MNCTDQTICTIVNFAYELDAGLFQPKFGSNMDKPKCWVKNVQLKVEFEITFLTQHLALSIFDPNLA